MPDKFKLYYDLMSQPSRALYIIFKLSGTPFENCPVALRKGEHYSDEYKTKVNRFQKVPCIIDTNGFKLSESIAILRYCSSKGRVASNLYPSDLAVRARVDELLEWQHVNIRLGCAMYFRHVWLEPQLTGAEPDKRRTEQFRSHMEAGLDAFENLWLGPNKFIAGEEVSAADVFAACEIEQPRMAGYDPTQGRPKLSAWLRNVRSATNPYYDEAHKYVNRIVQSSNNQSKL